MTEAAAGAQLVLAGGLVLRDAGSEPERLDVVIRDGRIADLLPPDAPLPDTAERLDVAHHLVMPGLVNAHYHSHDVLARGLFEDIPLEVWIALAILPPNRPFCAREIRLRTLLGAAENLRNGTTLVQDMLGCGPGSEPMIAAALDAYEEIGIRCVMGLQIGNRAAIDCLPGMRDTLPETLQPLLSPPQPDAGTLLRFVEDGLDFGRAPTIHWAIAPGAPQRCDLDLLAGLGELARRHGLPLVTHVNESRLQVFLARELYGRHGGSVLDYLEAAGVFDRRLLMAHGVWFSDAEIARIADAGAAVATNPASNLKLKNGIAPHGALHAAGVRLALGCDNVSAGDGQNMFEAMRLLALLASGHGAGSAVLGAREVLHAATQGGADALGLGDSIGSIAVGRHADLAVLDLDDIAFLPRNDTVRQLVYAQSGRGVRHVLVDGRMVLRDGAPARLDWSNIVAEAGDLAARLRTDYRAHFDRMAPVVPHIAELVRRQAARPLPYTRWMGAAEQQPAYDR